MKKGINVMKERNDERMKKIMKCIEMIIWKKKKYNENINI